MTQFPVDWIDILSDPAVRLAAHAWKKDLAETWGILSRAIEAGNISQRMTYYQFLVHVKLTANPQYFNHCPVCKTATNIKDTSCTNCHVELHKARRPLIEEEFKNFPIPLAPSPPPVLPTKQTVHTDENWISKLKERTVEQPKKELPTQPLKQENWVESPQKNKVNLWELKFLFSVGFILFCLSMATIGIFSAITSPSQPHPTSTPTFNSTAWFATIIAIGTEKACTDDAMYGVPSEYSRCNPNRQTEPPDEPYYFNEEPIDSTVPCLIKGNISFDTGEKIYHVPGQKYYDETTIDQSYGERWFCTEAEAQAAGWRKARE